LLPSRCFQFLQKAQDFIQTSQPRYWGWCPFVQLQFYEFFPFHLNHITRLAQFSRHFDSDTLLSVSFEATKAYFQTDFTKNCKFTLIQKTDWKSIYSCHFPFIPWISQKSHKKRKTNEIITTNSASRISTTDDKKEKNTKSSGNNTSSNQHHLYIYQQLELLFSRVLSNLCAQFLDQKLKEKNSKLQVLNFFQQQINCLLLSL
jgi:hypothetical protein